MDDRRKNADGLESNSEKAQRSCMPKLKKVDGQIYVVEPDGREYFAKLAKLQDGKIVAEYNRIDAETGEISKRQIALRRKKKAPPPPPLEKEGTRQGLLTKMSAQGTLRRRGSAELVDRPEDVDASSKDPDDDQEAEDKIAVQADNIDEFEDEMLEVGERKIMEFSEEQFSEAEVLVMDWLPDEVETLHVRQSRQSMIVSSDTAPVGRQALLTNAFRWKHSELVDEKVELPKFSDDFEGVEPHEDGVEPEGFNYIQYAEQRRGKPVMNGMPSKFKQIELSKPIEEMNEQEKIDSIAKMVAVDNPRGILYISLENSDSSGLGKNAELELIQQLNRFVDCEILIVRHLGLKRIDKLVMPKLLAADLVGNDIKDVKKVVRFCHNSPGLYQLDLRYNVIEKKPVYQPLIAEILSLHWYSGRVISDEQRYQAVGRFATEKVKRTYRALKIWEQNIVRVPAVHAMTKWQPHLLKHLKLTNLGLQRVFVGGMINLLSIDVSYNEIYTLQMSGFEKLDKLAAVNISHNNLGSEADLQLFQWTPALRVIILGHNQWPKDYRSRVLWACRNLRGKNHWPGLVEIDGQKVKRSEVLQANLDYGHMSESDLERMKWHLVLISYAGHYHLRIPGFTMRFANLEFPKKSLGHADVSAFGNLLRLDLAENRLVTVTGLSSLRKLRCLRLHGNVDLNLMHTLEQLKKIHSLWELTLAMHDSLGKDLLGPYRQNVLAATYHHAQLYSIDGHEISMQERIQAFQQAKPASTALEVQSYTLNLKLTICATKKMGRRYLDRDCMPGVQWDESEVTKLDDLTKLEMSDKLADYFWRFTNVQQLNLSENNIKSIVAFNLQQLPRLEILDVSFNKVNDSIKNLASHFDLFPSLKVLCLRGNESYNLPKHRLDLIGRMECFRRISCNLHTIDTVVTVDERIKALRSHGGSEQECEDLRLKFQLHGRLPLDVPQDRVHELVLNRANLKVTEGIMSFSHLKALCMRHNNITSVRGLERLHNLEVVDVRNNKLSKLHEVAAVINALEKLKVFAAAENSFSSGAKGTAKYRSSLIAMVQKLLNLECPLHFIDDEEVCPDEIVAHGFPKAKNTEEKVRHAKWIWAANLYRQVTRCTGRQKDLTEMDLTFRGISLVEVESSMFPALKKLSLKHNDLTSDGMKALSNLPSLEELDISFNSITVLKAMAGLVDALPKLRSVYLDNNPCFKDDTPPLRHQFIAALQQNQYLNAPLRVLNGLLIQVDERITGLQLARVEMFTQRRLRAFRTELGLEAIKARPDQQHIAMNEFKITSLGPLTKGYKQVVFLDLGQNELETLEGQGLETLENLMWLDLKDNKFASLIDSVIIPLTQCHKLRHLNLLHSTQNANETANVKDFIMNPVCYYLRGLDSVDETKNPKRMDDLARKGGDYLYETYAVGYNGITVMDLNDREIKPEEFPRFCTAMSLLHCEKLNCERNPWKEYPLFRFMLIEFAKSLQVIDGRKVHLAERQNAAHKIDVMKLKAKKEFLIDKGSNLDNAMEITKMGVAAAGVMGVAGMVAQESSTHEVYEPPVGSILSKIEIVINFLQTYAMLFTLTIHWPNWWISFNLNWVPAINLELDFDWLGFLQTYKYSIKFIVLALLPLLICFFVLDQFDPQESKWKNYYLGDGAKLTSKIHKVDMVFLALISVNVAYLADYLYYRDTHTTTSWELLNKRKGPNEMCVTVALTMIVFFLLLHVLRWIAIRRFRKHHHNATYWHNFIRLKKKAALFSLTIAYQPICKNVLTNFSKRFYEFTQGSWYLDTKAYQYPECMPLAERNTTEVPLDGDLYCCQNGMPDKQCLEKFMDFEWYHVASGVLAVFYVLVIPYALWKAVKQGTSDIDVNFNVPEKIERFKEREADLREEIKECKGKEMRAHKKGLKKELKMIQRQNKAMWAQYCKEFTNEQNYLYASYSRKDRSQKVKTMLEKCLLLMVTLYFTSKGTREFKPALGFLVVFIFLVSICIGRPFNDVVENVMDVVCRFANTFTAAVAILAERYYSEHYKDGMKDDDYGGISLAVVNLACVIVIFLGFAIMPARVWWSKRQAKKEAERMEREMFDDTSAAAALARDQTHVIGKHDELVTVKVGGNAVSQEMDTIPTASKRHSVLHMGNLESTELAGKATDNTADPQTTAAYNATGSDEVLKRIKTNPVGLDDDGPLEPPDDQDEDDAEPGSGPASGQ